jgi:hypothetical protein
MVKPKENYDKSSDDSRFEKFDKILDPTYSQKQFYILAIGIFVVCCIFAATTIINSLNAIETVKTSPYEDGLNISYIAKDKVFSITFTNPHSDTISASTIIQVPFDAQSSNPSYIKVYEYSSSDFPIRINYTPSQSVSTVNHYVTVTLIKDTGNYTYFYTAVPESENKMWDGIGKYIQGANGMFNTNESV